MMIISIGNTLVFVSILLIALKQSASSSSTYLEDLFEQANNELESEKQTERLRRSAEQPGY